MGRRVLAGLVLVGVLGISGAAFAGISLKPTAKQGVDAPVRRSLTPHEIKRLQEQGKPIPPDLMTPPPPGYHPTRPSTPQRPIDPTRRPDDHRPPEIHRPSDSHSHPYRPAEQTPTQPKRPSDYEQHRPSDIRRPSDSNSDPQRPQEIHRPDDRRPPFSRDRRVPPPDDRRPPYGNDDYRPRLPERK